MTLTILVMTAVITVTFGTQVIATDARSSSDALNEAQEMLEAAQALGRKDFKAVNPYLASDGIYAKELFVESDPDDPLTKQLTARVSWTGDYGRSQNVSLSGLVTNFENAVGADTCSSVAVGNWAAPSIADFSLGALVGDPSGAYPITDLDVYEKKLYITVQGTAQTAGPVFPGSASDDPGSGGTLPGWANPSRVTADDGNRASLTANGTETSHYIRATNLGLNVPQGATILGISAQIEKSRTGPGTTGEIRDSEVKLVRADGTVATQNKASAVNWSSTDTPADYGGSADLWGETWSAQDINDPDFGVVLSMKGTSNSPATNYTARVDYIRVSVTYTKSFYVFDISNPSAPAFLAGLSSNPAGVTGFNAVHVAGKYAYAAANSTANQLQVIDLSASPPQIVATLPDIGIAANSIFYRNGYVYLGLKGTSGSNTPEFHVIDVHTFPLTAASVVGSWPRNIDADMNNDTNAIYVQNGYAYLAHPTDAASPYLEQITILNLANQANLLRVGAFYQSPSTSGNGKALYLVGDKLYFGRTVTTGNPELFTLDATDPEASPLPLLGSKEIGASVDGIVVRDYLSFVVTKTPQLQIWNTSNPVVITEHAAPLALPGSAGVTLEPVLDCESNVIFAASNNISGAGYISVITAP